MTFYSLCMMLILLCGIVAAVGIVALILGFAYYTLLSIRSEYECLKKAPCPLYQSQGCKLRDETFVHREKHSRQWQEMK